MTETEESKTMLARFQMPFGDLYTRAWSPGDALKSIGARGGLLALNGWAKANRNRHPMQSVAKIVERFLALPENARDLTKANKRESERRATAARIRNANGVARRRRVYRAAAQQAEFDAHNRERGMLA